MRHYLPCLTSPEGSHPLANRMNFGGVSSKQKYDQNQPIPQLKIAENSSNLYWGGFPNVQINLRIRNHQSLKMLLVVKLLLFVFFSTSYLFQLGNLFFTHHSVSHTSREILFSPQFLVHPHYHSVFSCSSRLLSALLWPPQFLALIRSHLELKIEL